MCNVQDNINDYWKFIRFCYNMSATTNAESAISWIPAGGSAELAMDGIGDLDFMFVRTDVTATSPRSEHGKMLRIRKPSKLLICLADGVHPGYTRLKIDKGEYYTRRELMKDIPADGPAFTLPHTESTNDTVVKGFKQLMNMMNFLLMLQYETVNCTIKVDFVASIRCPEWPDEAREWLTRERCHDWPSRSLIRICQRRGCHIVAAAHKSSKNPDSEFRYSFSLAERELIRSWKPTQKYICRQLKQIKSYINKHFKADEVILNSYHLKTLMLWSCEEKSPDFWEPQQVVDSTRQLLCELIEYLVHGQCYNYFIRDNNMLDHVGQTDGQILQQLAERLVYCAEHIESFVTYQKYGEDTIQHRSVIPRSLLRFLLTTISVRCGLEKSRILIELYDLYRGLSAQLDLISQSKLLTDVEKETGLRYVTDCLYEAVTHDDELILVHGDNTDDIFTQIEKVASVDDCVREQLAHVKWKKTTLKISSDNCTCTTQPTKKQTPHRRDKKLPYLSQLECETSLCDILERQMGINGHFSWFCSMAYLANFLYTTRCDFDAATEVCDVIVNSDSKNFFPAPMADFFFQVVLSTEMSALYDEDIKSLLGFLTLYFFFLKQAEIISSDENVCIGVCPIIFALYVKTRCLQKKCRPTDDVERFESCKSAVDAVKKQCRQHFETYLSWHGEQLLWWYLFRSVN